ncbi:MAG: Ribonuclease P protein component 4 [Candidatus Methanofastidiosum methylothiophilum]|uniref:Ribonuclease P protein component 4 n=1 Tax=Candidatus Methanofastidiosum methylothiophilum TaxID=1705564 RepID=A0A150IXS7_9EURY|nr:MAG: Ribonuclease P protein component 4 [Candidatus Methanofastidiosum methylthiophilus]KYC47346.1 MAG: Ribonuclease P protein component 4 [Candidatus Methanofastidiosum methylthiophilus]KYC49797.1 MAG: Ribonuclease P protein component 4 [Candidatus Methanofastidiosum methylthiophilus]
MGWKERKATRKKVASDRIKELLKFSELHKDDELLSTNSIKTAVAISRRHKIRIPIKSKRKFCKKCSTVFIPDKTVRIRTGKGKITYTCLNCGHIKRIPYLKEKKEVKNKKLEI